MEYRNLIAKVRASEEVPVILVANKVGRRRKMMIKKNMQMIAPDNDILLANYAMMIFGCKGIPMCQWYVSVTLFSLVNSKMNS